MILQISEYSINIYEVTGMCEHKYMDAFKKITIAAEALHCTPVCD